MPKINIPLKIDRKLLKKKCDGKSVEQLNHTKNILKKHKVAKNFLPGIFKIEKIKIKGMI